MEIFAHVTEIIRSLLLAPLPPLRASVVFATRRDRIEASGIFLCRDTDLSPRLRTRPSFFSARQQTTLQEQQFLWMEASAMLLVPCTPIVIPTTFCGQAGLNSEASLIAITIREVVEACVCQEFYIYGSSGDRVRRERDSAIYLVLLVLCT